MCCQLPGDESIMGGAGKLTCLCHDKYLHPTRLLNVGEAGVRTYVRTNYCSSATWYV